LMPAAVSLRSRHRQGALFSGAGFQDLSTRTHDQHPYLARLFALAYPQFAEIFQYKQTPKAERDNWIHKRNGNLFK